MGREYVVICDSCRKQITNGKYYRVNVSPLRTGDGFSMKQFYFCEDCGKNGCIGNAIKNMKGEQA